MSRKFFSGVLVILIIYILAAWGMIQIAALNSDQIQGIIYSGIIGTVNIVLAYLIIRIAIYKDQKTFSKIFLGGLVARLLLLFVFIYLILNFSSTDRFVFIGSLFILYFIYQIWEVLILNNNVKRGSN